jgi:hypothetical protein
MLTKRVRHLLGVAAIAPFLLTSCDTNPFDPTDDVTGTYHLSVFAGRSIPALFSCQPGECEEIPNGGTIRVNDGTLVLHDDGTFVERNHFTFTSGGSSSNDTFLSTGTYNVNFDQLTLSAPAQNNQDARFINATVEFDTIHYIERDEFGRDFFYEYRR